MFFRKSRLEPLPVTMTAARMGERLLQIGIDDDALVGALAAKVGLSGVAALAVDNEKDATRARNAATAAGVFVDVQIAPHWKLSFPDASFDLVVVHSMRGLLSASRPEDRVALLREAHRVLRSGGRIILIESAPRGGLAGLLHPYKENERYAAADGATGALTAEGFHGVRVLGEREGYRFTEGVKT
jgi:SAM-dependent methyltransferase